MVKKSIKIELFLVFNYLTKVGEVILVGLYRSINYSLIITSALLFTLLIGIEFSQFLYFSHYDKQDGKCTVTRPCWCKFIPFLQLSIYLMATYFIGELANLGEMCSIWLLIYLKIMIDLSKPQQELNQPAYYKYILNFFLIGSSITFEIFSYYFYLKDEYSPIIEIRGLILLQLSLFLTFHLIDQNQQPIGNIGLISHHQPKEFSIDPKILTKNENLTLQDVKIPLMLVNSPGRVPNEENKIENVNFNDSQDQQKQNHIENRNRRISGLTEFQIKHIDMPSPIHRISESFKYQFTLSDMIKMFYSPCFIIDSRFGLREINTEFEKYFLKQKADNMIDIESLLQRIQLIDLDLTEIQKEMPDQVPFGSRQKFHSQKCIEVSQDDLLGKQGNDDFLIKIQRQSSTANMEVEQSSGTLYHYIKDQYPNKQIDSQNNIKQKQQMHNSSFDLDAQGIHQPREQILKGQYDNKIFQIRLFPLYEVISYEIVILIEDISLQEREQIQSSSNTFKSRILNSFSHQLRTPLNYSINLIESIISHKIRNREEISQILPIFYNNQLLLSIFNDIIDLGEINKGSVTFQHTSFNLKESLEEIFSYFTVPIASQKIETKLTFDPSVPTEIRNDSQRFSQVMLNLVGNAFQFTQRGQITISLQVVKKTDLLGKESQLIRVSIIDSGGGMNTEALKKLLAGLNDPFKTDIYSENDVAENFMNSQGFGLGFTISQVLIKGLSGCQGKIEIISFLNQGTSFSFYIQDFSDPPLLGLTLKKKFSYASTKEQFSVDIVKFDESFGNGANNATNNNLHFPLQIRISQPSSKSINPLQKKRNSTQIQTINLGSQTSISLKNRDVSNINVSISNKSQNNEQKESSLNSNCQLSNGKIPISSELIPEPSNINNPLTQSCDQINQDINYINPLNEPKRYQTFIKAPSTQVEIRQQFKMISEISEQQNDSLDVLNRILIVDDNEFNVECLQIIISAIGFQSDICYSGEDAIDIIVDRWQRKQSIYELIFMDIDMPGLDGFETSLRIFQFLRQSRIFDNIKICCCSAYTDIESRIKAQQSGMSLFLSKPIESNMLQNIIHTVFEKLDYVI